MRRPARGRRWNGTLSSMIQRRRAWGAREESDCICMDKSYLLPHLGVICDMEVGRHLNGTGIKGLSSCGFVVVVEAADSAPAGVVKLLSGPYVPWRRAGCWEEVVTAS